MRTTVVRRLLMAGVAVLAVGGLMAACGSDSKNTTDTGSGGTSTTGATTSESSTTAGKAAAFTVSVKKNPTLGNILASPDGKTLYTLTDSSGKALACTGQCLSLWPPLKLAAGATTPSAPRGVALTVVDGPSGTKLVAAKGLPLYTFSGDSSASDAAGEGLQGFGGTWHVVKTSAAVTPASGSGGSGGGSGSGTSETTTTAYSTY
jgi:predicted lipoprotein with Yx(FWY)xxD motif